MTLHTQLKAGLPCRFMIWPFPPLPCSYLTMNDNWISFRSWWKVLSLWSSRVSWILSVFLYRKLNFAILFGLNEGCLELLSSPAALRWCWFIHCSASWSITNPWYIPPHLSGSLQLHSLSFVSLVEVWKYLDSKMHWVCSSCMVVDFLSSAEQLSCRMALQCPSAALNCGWTLG